MTGWHWQTEDTEVPSASVRDADGKMLARCLSTQGGHRKGEYPADYEEIKKRARLFAAAPDLLAALIEARDIIADSVGPDSELVPIDAAIAKARGAA